MFAQVKLDHLFDNQFHQRGKELYCVNLCTHKTEKVSRQLPLYRKFASRLLVHLWIPVYTTMWLWICNAYGRTVTSETYFPPVRREISTEVGRESHRLRCYVAKLLFIVWPSSQMDISTIGLWLAWQCEAVPVYAFKRTKNVASTSCEMRETI